MVTLHPGYLPCTWKHSEPGPLEAGIFSMEHTHNRFIPPGPLGSACPTRTHMPPLGTVFHLGRASPTCTWNATVLPPSQSFRKCPSIGGTRFPLPSERCPIEGPFLSSTLSTLGPPSPPRKWRVRARDLFEKGWLVSGMRCPLPLRTAGEGPLTSTEHLPLGW